MKDAARLLLYLVGVILLGALLAPPLFWLGQSVIAHGFLPSLAKFDFESYFHRALLIAAVILLWPLLHALRVRSWRDLALEKNSRAGGDLGMGFAIAAFPLLCCGAVIIALHVYSLRRGFLWHKMPAVVVAASFVPILEELLFRGFILGVLLRSFSRLGALLLTSG
ncbi:MAG TPA: CPBP family glutamic-type intramembrane protease, partial [Chthoniobacterales bacterium]